MKKDSIIEIDLAKSIFSVCVMSKRGKVLERCNRVSRRKLLELIKKLDTQTIAMEACGGAHYWARLFESHGFDTRIIAAQFVKPFVKSNKNDEIDAEAICEAALRPQMRFVSTKTEEQQDIQSLHRIRARLIKSRTALVNEIRGILLEYGLTISKGVSHVRTELMDLVEENSFEHSELWKESLLNLHEELTATDERIKHYDNRIKAVAHSNEICKRLLKASGVGEKTATAAYAAAGNGSQFKNGRNFAAWIGLTPKQYTTGGKPKLGSISKRGNNYLRKMLVQGARSVAIAADYKRNHKDPDKRTLNKTEQWFFEIAERRGKNKAVVALANKTARRIWEVLQGKDFMQPEQLFAQAA